MSLGWAVLLFVLVSSLVVLATVRDEPEPECKAERFSGGAVDVSQRLVLKRDPLSLVPVNGVKRGDAEAWFVGGHGELRVLNAKLELRMPSVELGWQEERRVSSWVFGPAGTVLLLFELGEFHKPQLWKEVQGVWCVWHELDVSMQTSVKARHAKRVLKRGVLSDISLKWWVKGAYLSGWRCWVILTASGELQVWDEGFEKQHQSWREEEVTSSFGATLLGVNQLLVVTEPEGHHLGGRVHLYSTEDRRKRGGEFNKLVRVQVLCAAELGLDEYLFGRYVVSDGTGRRLWVAAQYQSSRLYGFVRRRGVYVLQQTLEFSGMGIGRAMMVQSAYLVVTVEEPHGVCVYRLHGVSGMASTHQRFPGVCAPVWICQASQAQIDLVGTSTEARALVKWSCVDTN